MSELSFRPEIAILSLGDAFYDPVAPARFPQTILRYRNQRWAERVGLGGLGEAQWLEHFARFQPLPGSLPQPLALRYHGHQFRTYNPDIGDGRGFLFAQLRDLLDGRLLDLGTKGSGQTPYSRFGDGRLTLKGGVREALATERLEALGVHTSKTFSLVETGEPLERGDEPSPTRSAVLVRLSHSHIRYGTFQRLAYFDLRDEMARLVDYCLTDLLAAPAAPDASINDKAAKLMNKAVESGARLAAQYMAAGFVHGVLNTDNINITGESFDYGPYRFAPAWDPGFTAAYFDQGGLYAYGRQAESLHWNSYALGKALLTIADQSAVIPALERFPACFERALIEETCRRLGVRPSGDSQINLALLETMEGALGPSRFSLDRFYFDAYGGALSAQRRARSPAASVYGEPAFATLFERLDALTPACDAAANLDHPYWAGAEPTTLLIGEIEQLWSRIADEDDWSGFDAAIAAQRRMGEAMGRSAARPA